MLLRSATPKDYAPRIAELIWSEDPVLIGLEFQSFEGWAEVLAAEWPTSGASNSHDATTLAIQNGDVCGLINAFPASELEARMMRSEILRGPSALSSELADHIDALFFDPDPSAFYILDLAIHVTAQKTGLGVILVNHAEARAKAIGATSLSLDVSVANPAVGFYQHIGFQIKSQSNVPALRAYGQLDHLHMTRMIDQ